VHSVAWLGDDEHGQVAEAVMELGRLAHEARVELLNDSFSSVSTFFGVVRRMDAIAAEVEGEDGVVLLVPRDTLEREGLAVLGQAVAMLCEVLPAGGTLILPMPAVMLDAEAYWRERHKNLESLIRTTDPWDVETAAGGVSVISDRDRTWLDRETGRAPNTVPVAPIRRA
jgi:hypothetical protein